MSQPEAAFDPGAVALRADGPEPTRAVDPDGLYASRPPGAGGSDQPDRGPRVLAGEVIDVAAVARMLHVGRNTAYALVARHALPHRRLGKQIRFHRGAIMRRRGSSSSHGASEKQ